MDYQRYVDDVFSLPDGSRILMSWPMPLKVEDKALVEEWLKLMAAKMLRIEFEVPKVIGERANLNFSQRAAEHFWDHTGLFCESGSCDVCGKLNEIMAVMRKRGTSSECENERE